MLTNRTPRSFACQTIVLQQVFAAGFLMAISCFADEAVDPSTGNRSPLPGQIIIDAEHPQWLMRHGGNHVFICGPGDPEDFLYLGRRNSDGSRNGDQIARIEKLIRHGGNCIYMQIVRTHGGDAGSDSSQNPFVDSNPANGLDEDILSQWEEWFSLMDQHKILIYLFFYDDGAQIWDTGDEVGPQERAFLEGIVDRFEHHKNLIWVVAEESEERYSTERVQEIAKVIRAEDEHGHLVGNHHQSGTRFKSWQPGGALSHFSMQLAAAGDEAHHGAIEALTAARGHYQIIYSESTAAPTDPASARKHAWSVAMGGVMPMLLRMDIASTPDFLLEQCRYLQEFFESTDFYTMRAADPLANSATKYVLADSGRSYIAYSDDISDTMGIKAMPGGTCLVTWLECQTGVTTTQEFRFAAPGDRLFHKPDSFGIECAVWVRFPSVDRPDLDSFADAPAADVEPLDAMKYFPPPDADGGWRVLKDAETIRNVAGLDVAKLDEAFAWIQRDTKNGGLLVLRNGWLVYERYFGKGHRESLCNLGSCGKSFTSIAAGILVDERQDLFPDGLSQKVYTPEYLPAEAFPLTDPRKKGITLGQLLTMTSGIRGNNPVYVHGKAATIEPAGPDGWQALVDSIAMGHQDAKYLVGERKGQPLSTKTLWCDPGGGWSYATSSIHLVSTIIRHVTGMELEDYIARHLAEPLGWGRWSFGYKQATQVSHTPGGGGIALRATDMLRFGYLLLRDGRWQDQQLVPASYVRHCATRSPFNPHYDYSLQFDVNTGGRIPGVPRDAYWKLGSGGHALYVVPSLDLVIWKLGGRDGQYSQADVGVAQHPDVPSNTRSRAGWRRTTDGVDAAARTLQLVVDAVVKTTK